MRRKKTIIHEALGNFPELWVPRGKSFEIMIFQIWDFGILQNQRFDFGILGFWMRFKSLLLNIYLCRF